MAGWRVVSPAKSSARMDNESASKAPRECLICTTSITASHFGMDCCRACTTFFKRSKLSGRKYACRSGSRQCEIVKDDRFACRRCRFKKCLRLGMIYDRPMRVNKKDLSKDKTREEPSTAQHLTAEVQTGSILTRIGIEFDACVERRRLQEEKLLSGKAEQIIHHKQTLFLGSYRNSMATFDITAAETITFLRNVFPAFDNLQEDDFQKFYHSYLPIFCMAETVQRTRELWGETRRFFMSSVSLCIDADNLEEWLGEQEIVGDNRRTVIETMKNYTTAHIKAITPIANKCMITRNEFCAMLALLLVDFDSSPSDQVSALCDQIRRDVLDDLQKYYREVMELNNFATRLGNLMTMCYTIRESDSVLRQSLLLYNSIFDLYRSSDLIQHILS